MASKGVWGVSMFQALTCLSCLPASPCDDNALRLAPIPPNLGLDCCFLSLRVALEKILFGRCDTIPVRWRLSTSLTLCSRRPFDHGLRN
ncbi:hypothetical protein BCR34DRAFT_121732 [Clohesyomyces aquaticus]|uniref:Secreted protein n=1 Tax=Clohesyomyces aquaticus TaxID=1231657 RepID=A0A1Y1YPR9_9PLEO|nr:hypothetical protein BCR34DRAFT_121732 [Clohesyomyces aquaticus]